MSDVIYWLWLQNRVGAGNSYKELLEHFGSAEAIYNSSEDELKDVPYLKRKRALPSRLCDKNQKESQKIIDTCKKYKIHILTPDDERFPERLRNIPYAPAALFVRGDVDCLNAEFPIASIGSRMPSKYGEDSARKIVSELVTEGNAVIVSGGALGIDSVSHHAALESGGKTVLVMGHGHGHRYLMENSELRKRVYSHGALVSEYPPFTEVSPESFPMRNRIISGLSKAVVIIEAAEYSGTFSTANHALRQKRDVFVLPGDIESGNYAGSNLLITQGAFPIFSGKELISHYDGVERKSTFGKPKNDKPFENVSVSSEFSKKSRKKSVKKAKKTDLKSETADVKSAEPETSENKIKKIPETISKNAEMVYNLMSDGNCTLDELTNHCELMPSKILVALTELELEGIITKTADSYRIV